MIGHVPVILVLVPMVMVLANHGRFFHIYLLMVVVVVDGGPGAVKTR